MHVVYYVIKSYLKCYDFMLVWDQAKMSRLRWLWYDVTTFEAYTEETSYENSLLVQQCGALALSSLTHVMKSLTPNARGIFRLIVQYQIERKDDAHYQGIPRVSIRPCKINYECGSIFSVFSVRYLFAKIKTTRTFNLFKEIHTIYNSFHERL